MRVVKELERKYYKDLVFEQPVLTSNGVVGGDTIAVQGSTTASRIGNWYSVFSGSEWLTPNGYGVPQWLTYYTPYKIKLRSFSTVPNNNVGAYVPKDITIYGSNDNINFIKIGDVVNNAYNKTLQNFIINSSSYYKYHRFYARSTIGLNTEVYFQDIQLNAVYKVEATQEDYDFYKDVPKYKLPKLQDKYYGINQ